VRHWLEVEYPEIQKQAKAEGAEIHWGDEMGVRSDHPAGRTWSRKATVLNVKGAEHQESRFVDV
jgi:hypothetical protein